MDDPQTPTGQLGTILDRTRWRVALQLGGMGDSVVALLPLFALTALDQSVGVAASTVSAYTAGSMIGHLFVWGRLADRLTSPRLLVIAGTAIQGALILLIAVAPGFAGIVAVSAVLGLFAVSMDGALTRLVVGDLAPRARVVAITTFASLLERGVLYGLALSTAALAVLSGVTSEATALRLVLATIGIAILVESAIALSTVGRQRAAPRLGAAIGDLVRSGAVVIWGGAAGPVQRVLRVGPATVQGDRLPDSLRLMLVSLAILHTGYALQGSLIAIYLSDAAGLAGGATIAILLGGAVMSAFAATRVASWLETVPAVQIQLSAATVRVVSFAGFGLLAFAPDALGSIAVFGVVFLLSQLAWGAVIVANSQRFADLAPASRRAEVVALQNVSTGAGGVLGAALGAGVAQEVGFAEAFLVSAVLSAVGAYLLSRW
jgi:MFS family permease